MLHNKDSNVHWKKLENYSLVTQFTSNSKNNDYGKSKIYLKFFEALESSKQGKPTTIFLLHELGQHHGRFKNFIKWMRKECPQHSLVCMDFVGHGLSSGTRGHFEHFDQLVDDVLSMLSLIEKKADDQWILLGHGLGGVAILDLMSRYQHLTSPLVDKIILSNFTLKFPVSFHEIEDQMGTGSGTVKKIFSHIRPFKLFKSKVMLTHPTDILEFEQDPLVVHRPTINSVKEIQKKLSNIYQDSYFLDKPILLLKSQSDPLIQIKGLEYFAKGIKKELISEKNYSLMKHDLYNEFDREIVFNDIASWIDKT